MKYQQFFCNLSQKNDHKIVSYSSRALTPTERRCSQLELQCLTIMYACERNRLYLFGRPFAIHTDHKPIVTMLNNSNARVPLRIERMTLHLRSIFITLKETTAFPII